MSLACERQKGEKGMSGQLMPMNSSPFTFSNLSFETILP